MTFSIATQAITAAIMLLYTVFLFKKRNNRRIITLCFISVFVAGTGLYYFGYSHEPIIQGGFATLVRSMVSALKLFIYDNDLLEIEHVQHGTRFLEFFIPVYAAAILTSSITVINAFGEKLTGKILLATRSRKNKFKHVFIGMEERSLMIARELGSDEIAFIVFNNEKHSGNLHHSIAETVKYLTGGDETAWNPKGHVTFLTAKESISEAGPGEDILSRIGVGALYRYIDNHTSFYLLSEDAEQNFHDILALESDPALRKMTIHASVLRKGLAPAYRNVLKGTGAHFIFPSSLSVVDLMKNVECHPVSVMDIDTDSDGKGLGTVSGRFGALVCGFGETGQAATKFIYEFSAAIRKDGSPIPTTIYVQDSSIADCNGLFTALNPEMDRDGIIQYDNIATGSSAYWEFLRSHLDELNYIVIATGSDENNLDSAIQILNYASKVRKDGLKNFKILIRKTYTKQHENSLIAKYNQAAGAEILRFFGEYSGIFAADMIVSGNQTGINKDATGIASGLMADYERLAGYKTADLWSKTGDAQSDARNRLELHQYVSRANHIPTKLKMIHANENPDDSVIEALAQCEHLRYTRYLKAHEYSNCAQDDHILKHSCELKNWADLSETEKDRHRTMARASIIS